MTLHSANITLNIDGNELEDIPADFEVDQSFEDYSHPDNPRCDMRGGYTAELLKINLGGLELDRNQIEQMTSMATIELLEERCRDELNNE